MFGLMRPQNSCSTKKNDPNYLHHRRHYCGTCKAIGQHYNQQSRLMLNWDTVFLSELLSQLESQNLETWDQNLQSVNTCFSMPTEQLPFSLEYSAAASVLLGSLKIEDNIQDDRLLRWTIAKRVYASPFKKALNQFKNWNIDTIYIQDWIEQQNQRELQNKNFNNLLESLNYYAEATAHITAYTFQQGGLRLKEATDLHQLGYAFGQLMYILDAFEDYEKDVFKNQFNPISKYFGATTSLKPSQFEQVRSIILALQQEVQHFIDVLDIEVVAKTIYKDRLASNLALRLYKERIVPKTMKEKIALRWKEAKDVASQLTCQPKTWMRQLNYYVIVLAVFVNPQTKTYLPEEGKLQVAGWALLITTLLAGIGITGVIRRSRKEKRKQKRKEKGLKRFKRRLKNLFSRKRGCWSDCCGSCCDQCCSDCCGNCCDSCCEWMCEDDNLLIALIICISVAVIITIVLLVLFFLGLL